ncbi:hypothetical protein RBWH47_00208 [Rhodopirellula baltica WH47]|uniref:Uncharacterized protein n=1 Tax=Rhodopirellula baltica WH47 TaxID=991778 RepID=F2AR68_RHOBT|nr:hypothetical protein RBWH47_00208 [Rhodopirellula baltica WH47]
MQGIDPNGFDSAKLRGELSTSRYAMDEKTIWPNGGRQWFGHREVRSTNCDTEKRSNQDAPCDPVNQERKIVQF